MFKVNDAVGSTICSSLIGKVEKIDKYNYWVNIGGKTIIFHGNYLRLITP